MTAKWAIEIIVAALSAPTATLDTDLGGKIESGLARKVAQQCRPSRAIKGIPSIGDRNRSRARESERAQMDSTLISTKL